MKYVILKMQNEFAFSFWEVTVKRLTAARKKIYAEILEVLVCLLDIFFLKKNGFIGLFL